MMMKTQTRKFKLVVNEFEGYEAMMSGKYYSHIIETLASFIFIFASVGFGTGYKKGEYVSIGEQEGYTSLYGRNYWKQTIVEDINEFLSLN